MTATWKEQAKAASALAGTIRSKALDEYGAAMGNDPESTDAKIKLERFILSLRAEHEAMCEVYRAIMAEKKAARS